MSFGRAIKPCEKFKHWPNHSICGICAWPEKDHGTDASDEGKAEETPFNFAEEIMFEFRLGLNEPPKVFIPKTKCKIRRKPTHLIPKKKKRK